MERSEAVEYLGRLVAEAHSVSMSVNVFQGDGPGTSLPGADQLLGAVADMVECCKEAIDAGDAYMLHITTAAIGFCQGLLKPDAVPPEPCDAISSIVAGGIRAYIAS